MAVNHVELSDGTTLIDLRADTVTANRLLPPYTAHDKAGNIITGGITRNGDAGTNVLSSKSDVFTINKGYYNSTGTVSIDSDEQAKIIASNIKDGIDILGVTGSFTSDATATSSDILSGKKAYANGEALTGSYSFIYPSINSGSTGCSTSRLRVSCSFEPSGIAVVSNTKNRTANSILAVWATKEYFCTICNGEKASLTDTYAIDRTEASTNISNYWYYSNGYVYINRPNTTYSWAASNSNYRVMCFK